MKIAVPIKIGDRWFMELPVYTNGINHYTSTKLVSVMPELAAYYDATINLEKERYRETGIARYYRENPDAA